MSLLLQRPDFTVPRVAPPRPFAAGRDDLFRVGVVCTGGCDETPRLSSETTRARENPHTPLGVAAADESRYAPPQYIGYVGALQLEEAYCAQVQRAGR